MIYILFIMTVLQGRDGGNAVITSSAEFNNSKACLFAAEQLATRGNINSKFICVPKGTK